MNTPTPPDQKPAEEPSDEFKFGDHLIDHGDLGVELLTTGLTVDQMLDAIEHAVDLQDDK